MMPLELLQNVFRSIVGSIVNMLIYPSTLKTITLPPTLPRDGDLSPREHAQQLERLSREVSRTLTSPCSVRRMLAMSVRMRKQYREKLLDSNACMLPSFCHTMPTGREKGTFIVLDVGGSTIRVALVDLHGRSTADRCMNIKHIITSVINESVRQLPAPDFFDWMATRIQDMLRTGLASWQHDMAIPVGLTWSFPLEQTSHRGGKMQSMGKGFRCHEGIIGQDLGKLIEAACTKRGFSVQVAAIVNDSSATLLSQAYIDPSTSMGLIVGTGTNLAAFLPTSSMGRSKFGLRDPSWFEQADQVITNTELSMFGKGILPMSRWDESLNKAHFMPDFQPLEYKTTGRYLGELFRLVIAEAVETRRLFGGAMPELLCQPYSLDTAILAKLELDKSQSLATSIAMIQESFALKSTPRRYEVAFLRSIAQAISHRAAAYLAVAIHALWALQKETTDSLLKTIDGDSKTSIACNGSVILKYPGFKDRCEAYISQMIATGSIGDEADPNERVVLKSTDEAAVYGAAVAVALAEAT